MNTDTLSHFWSRVDRTDGCWLWTGPVDHSGYGLGKIKLAVNRLKTVRAHIISVRLHGREIPRGMQCDHLCDTRRCVRPDHISITTPRLNNLRGGSAAAVHNRKTSCDNGHSLHDAYRIKRARGGIERVCRICQRSRSQKYERSA